MEDKLSARKEPSAAEIKREHFKRECANLGVRPGVAKAMMETNFNNLTEYRAWKKRLKE